MPYVRCTRRVVRHMGLNYPRWVEQTTRAKVPVLGAPGRDGPSDLADGRVVAFWFRTSMLYQSWPKSLVRGPVHRSTLSNCHNFHFSTHQCNLPDRILLDAKTWWLASRDCKCAAQSRLPSGSCLAARPIRLPFTPTPFPLRACFSDSPTTSSQGSPSKVPRHLLLRPNTNTVSSCQ